MRLALFFALAAFLQLCAQPALDGPIASWSFDEKIEKKVPDTSGNGYGLNIVSALQVKGVKGAAFAYSEQQGDVYLAASNNLPLKNKLTISAWFSPATPGQNQFAAIVRMDKAFALRFSSGQLGYLLWNGNSIHSLHTHEKTWEPNRWYHVAATFDGSNMELYLDGQSVARKEGILDLEILPLAIMGVGSLRGNQQFNGSIDELSIYARALTAAEIRQQVESGRKALEVGKKRVFNPRSIGDKKKIFRKPFRPAGTVEKGFIWIDAEDFREYGGWTLDTQFVYTIGSAYLLATGVGTPVADAKTEIEVREGGTYRVWLRARNWVKDYSPGTFQLLVNGKALKETFGDANSAEWIWEDGGTVTLEPGNTELALHDLTGYYGRCDAIILTTDNSYKPPAERKAICNERARLSGLDLTPKDGGDYDVIVVGAGPAGCPAAIAAARMGAKTALIQNRPVLGGNASDECGVPLNGAASQHRNARETGIAEEVGRYKARYGYRGYSVPFMMLCEQEKNLSVHLNRHVFAVEMNDAKTIRSVKAIDTLTGSITTYRAKQFIDCTGDGWVGYYAKAEFRLGREGRDEHNESLAPEKADGLTMSGCLMGNGLGLRARDVGKETPFKRPPWTREIKLIESPGRSIRSVSSGNWWMENPNDLDDLFHAEEARDDLIKVSLSYFDFVKNKSKMTEEAKNYAITHIPWMLAKRESRRLIGDYILTQNDCLDGKVFPDRISYGGWPMDVHHPEGIFSGEKGSFWCNARVPIYTIPYRTLYSKNIDNLLFAGRCASVTHIALGTIRIESTLATMGQAAGTAAGMCIQLQTSPRGIYRNHIKQLQQILLKHDQSIPGISNEDPADLARKATATASSTTTSLSFTRAKLASRHDPHALDANRRGMFLPWANQKLEKIEVFLNSTADEPRTLKLHLGFSQKADEAPNSKNEQMVQELQLPAKHRNWVSFDVKMETTAPFLWFWLETAEQVSWELMETAPENSYRFYGGVDAWVPVKTQFYACRTEPGIAIPATFDPGFVVNGTARQWDGKTNMWASNPQSPLPQWIELDFQEKTTFNSVYLTFDTDLNPRLPTAANPPEAVRDYQLQIPTADGGWKTIVEVKGNFLRRRIHRFEALNSRKLRVKVLATNRAKEARIFEVRVYNE